MALVSFNGVDKIYADGATAVGGLDLDVADGQLMVLVGPSGCGKTTAQRVDARSLHVFDPESALAIYRGGSTS